MSGASGSALKELAAAIVEEPQAADRGDAQKGRKRRGGDDFDDDEE